MGWPPQLRGTCVITTGIRVHICLSCWELLTIDSLLRLLMLMVVEEPPVMNSSPIPQSRMAFTMLALVAGKDLADTPYHGEGQQSHACAT